MENTRNDFDLSKLATGGKGLIEEADMKFRNYNWTVKTIIGG